MFQNKPKPLSDADAEAYRRLAEKCGAERWLLPSAAPCDYNTLRRLYHAGYVKRRRYGWVGRYYEYRPADGRG